MVAARLSRYISVPHLHAPALIVFSLRNEWGTVAAIARTAAPMFKKLARQIGDKNSSIVLADADPYEAIT